MWSNCLLVHLVLHLLPCPCGPGAGSAPIEVSPPDKPSLTSLKSLKSWCLRKLKVHFLGRWEQFFCMSSMHHVFQSWLPVLQSSFFCLCWGQWTEESSHCVLRLALYCVLLLSFLSAGISSQSHYVSYGCFHTYLLYRKNLLYLRPKLWDLPCANITSHVSWNIGALKVCFNTLERHGQGVPFPGYQGFQKEDTLSEWAQRCRAWGR